MRKVSIFRTFRRNQSGATAVEFAIVCLPLILLSLGVVDFGRALSLRNELSFAADAGARSVLIGNHQETAVEQAVRAAFIHDDVELTIRIGSEIVDAREYRTVNLSYPLTFIMPGLSGREIALNLSRRVPVH